MWVFKSVGIWFVCAAALALPAPAVGSQSIRKRTSSGHSSSSRHASAHRAGKSGGSKARSAKGKGNKATGTSRYASHSHGKGSGKHRTAARRVAKRDQEPVREETLEEIFPPGHKFTDEEKAEASAIGVYMQNGMWKDAYKYSTKAGRQHPDRW
ncbi:MAG: hypothetical protein JO069_01675, partial [Verrucomicrobia bacterium]|nr:hypothetical protein [Verrucomicrobiota bacterium]